MRRVGHEDLVAFGVAAGAVVGADHQDAGQLAVRAGRRLERDGVHAADLDERLLELPQQLERALGDLVGRQRVERGEAGQPGGPLVDLGVALHRARAERVEARVDRVVQLRQVDEVADDLGLVELGQGRRLRAPVLGGDPVERVVRRMRDLAAAAARASTARRASAGAAGR